MSFSVPPFRVLLTNLKITTTENDIRTALAMFSVVSVHITEQGNSIVELKQRNDLIKILEMKSIRLHDLLIYVNLPTEDDIKNILKSMESTLSSSASLLESDG